MKLCLITIVCLSITACGGATVRNVPDRAVEHEVNLTNAMNWSERNQDSRGQYAAGYAGYVASHRASHSVKPKPMCLGMGFDDVECDYNTR